MSRVRDIKGPDPEVEPPFKIYNLDELDELKDPEPLIDGVLTRGCVALLFGAYGTAKSFLALDWAAHLACGKDWFKHEIYGEFKVLYVAAEGASGLKKRRKAWEMGHDQAIPRDNLHIVRVAVRFGNDETHYDYLKQMIIENEYDLIIVDTLSRNTPGMDENGPDMSLFIERMFELRDAHSVEKTAFLMVHHAGKDKGKGARGWTGIPAATDFSYCMSKASDLRDVFTLSTDRVKDMEALEDMTFKLRVHVVNEEWHHTSCTLALEEDDQQQSQFSRNQVPTPVAVPQPPWEDDGVGAGHMKSNFKPKKSRGRSRARGPNGRGSG